MKINKKSAIAVVLAVIVLLIIGSCAAAQASTRPRGCVTNSEFFDFAGDMSPNQVDKLFGTHGKLLSKQVVPFEATYLTIRYNKCGSWGRDRNVVILYKADWQRLQSVRNAAYPWDIKKH